MQPLKPAGPFGPCGFCAAQNRLGLLAAGFVAVLVLGTGPRVVSASCGDYVMVGGHLFAGDSNSHHVTVEPMTRETPVAPGARPLADESLPPVPCHGPNCRRQLPVPAQPVPPRSNSHFDHWACQLTTNHFREPGCRPAFGEAPLLISAGHSWPLERPPRPVG